MSTQPKVQRLVEDLSYVAKYSDSEHWATLAEAASKLRRLHDDYENALKHFAEAIAGYKQMAAQRDALLAALKEIDKEFKKHGRQHWPEAVKARAAIAKAEYGVA